MAGLSQALRYPARWAAVVIRTAKATRQAILNQVANFFDIYIDVWIVIFPVRLYRQPYQRRAPTGR